MKILYGEGDFLGSGHQIMAYPATVAASSSLEVEANVMHTQPDVRESMHNMFSKNKHFDVPSPELGDVIWTQTSGNKWIASMLVFDQDGHMHWDALEACLKSVKNKAIELDQEQISMPLRWYPLRDMKMYWNRTYNIIEEVLSDPMDEDIVGRFQVFVYDQDSDFVRDMVESLPGRKEKFYSDIQIRLR